MSTKQKDRGGTGGVGAEVKTMTTTEIQNLSGLELAREVALKVMRVPVTVEDGTLFAWFGDRNDKQRQFRPDRDGSAMLEVVERMLELGFAASIFGVPRFSSVRPLCMFRRGVHPPQIYGESVNPPDGCSATGTIPERVCRAALLAVAAKGGE